MADKIREWLVQRHPSPKSESPIEGLLFAGLEFTKHQELGGPDDGFVMDQQVEVGNYRVDFMFTGKDEHGKLARLAVEADGHDFHEKTKEQAARDKQRDRDLALYNVQTMHFTGSEVWANPFACAEEIRARLYGIRFGGTAKSARGRAALASLRAMFAAEDAA